MQLKHCLSRAKEFLGKFRNTSMSPHAKRLAITTFIEPAILYPLLNTFYSLAEIKPIESILSQLKCSALGLNRNFPHAVLHCPILLGGIGIPSLTQKNAKDRILYFLFNLCRRSTVRDKLEVSIIYTQMEVRTFPHYLTCSYAMFGHLATMVACVQIWRDTEPFGLHLRPAQGISWTPNPLAPNDQSLMEIAILQYNKKGSYIINRCRIYLQVILIYDLLLFRSSEIHPSYILGKPPPSCTSEILWLTCPRPPKHYWKLWHHFLHFCIKPMLEKMELLWDSFWLPRYIPSFFKHRLSPHLYRWQEGQMTRFTLGVIW